jgi:hypothetical protein
MDIVLIVVLVIAVLAIAGSGYGYYSARPVATTQVVEGPVAGPSPIISVIGVIGLLLLVAFFVMWLTGWRFGFQMAPPP